MHTASSEPARHALAEASSTGIGHDPDVEVLRRETRRVLTERFPVRRIRDLLDAPPNREQAVERARLGWSGALIAPVLGGGGATLLQTAAIGEEHGRALFRGSLDGVAAVVTAFQSTGGERHGHLLRGIADGSVVPSWAGCPTAGLGETTLEVEASKSGASVLLTGTASTVQDADVADVLLVTARRTDGGVLHAVVPADAPGVERQPLRFFDVTRTFSRVTFHDVALAERDTFDDPGGELLRRMLVVSTVLTCADASGAARKLTEMTVEYAQNRMTFGRPVASYQAIKHKCADMLVAVEGSETVSRYAAVAVDSRDVDMPTAVSTAKSYVSDAAAHVAGESQQIHGGIGFTWEHDLHLYVRRIKADSVLYGSAAAHRSAIAAVLVRRHSVVSR